MLGWWGDAGFGGSVRPSFPPIIETITGFETVFSPVLIASLVLLLANAAMA